MVVIVVVAVIIIVVVVVVGLNAVLWWTVWVGSVPLDIRRAKAQNRTSPCQKFLSIWSHVHDGRSKEQCGVASVRRSGDSKQKGTFVPDFFVRDGRSKDPSASEITELLTKRTNPYSTQAPAKRKLARTLKRGLGRIVASSSLKELLARLSAILGVSLLADNAASL